MTSNNETPRDREAVAYLENQKQHTLAIRDQAVKTYYRSRMQGSNEVEALRNAITQFARPQ